jgi:hypothetical protein
MTDATHRTYLTQEADLTAMLRRMERLPSYRPAGFAQGNAGLAQAAEYLADHREATRELATEGDG